MLALHGITIHGRIKSIGPHADDSLLEGLPDWEKLCGNPFPAAGEAAAQLMQQYILDCKAAGDSAGGVIETAAFGLPPGLGDPFFNSIESVAASLFFSIPAVKGVEFGDGFALATAKGSQANDPIGLVNGLAQPLANHSGGILGGISTGLPFIARLAVKPTPSIALPQQSVDPGAMRETTLEIKGRHDPCIVPRAVPVAEAALALAILDCMPEGGPQ